MRATAKLLIKPTPSVSVLFGPRRHARTRSADPSAAAPVLLGVKVDSSATESWAVDVAGSGSASISCLGQDLSVDFSEECENEVQIDSLLCFSDQSDDVLFFIGSDSREPDDFKVDSFTVKSGTIDDGGVFFRLSGCGSGARERKVYAEEFTQRTQCLY